LGLFFCGAAFFWKACGLLVFGLVVNEICLLFADFCYADCFFSKFMALLLFPFTAKGRSGRVFMKISSFWAWFFGFASLLFYLIFLMIFSFC